MERRERVRMVQMQRALELNEAAKERQRRQKLKDEKQTAFFESATKRNEALERKTEYEIESMKYDIESKKQTKKGRLASFIVEYWTPNERRIPYVPYSKMEMLRFVKQMKETDPKRGGMMMLLSMMETKASTDNLEAGLQIAFFEEQQ